MGWTVTLAVVVGLAWLVLHNLARGLDPGAKVVSREEVNQLSERTKYRLENDPIRLIRFKQCALKGCTGILRGVTLAGVSHRTSAVMKFMSGSDLNIVLEREPENPMDPNAIKIIGHWVKGGAKHSSHIGHLPKEDARMIAKNFPLDDLLGVIDELYRIETTDQLPSVRLSVFVGEKQQETAH